MSADRISILKGLAKFRFLVSNFVAYYIPTPIYRTYMRLRFAMLPHTLKEQAQDRINYYIRLGKEASIPYDQSVAVKDFKYPFGKKKKFSAYFFDLFQTVRMFAPANRFCYLFGDVDWDTDYPTFVKSRPIHTDESICNSVLCRLNKMRHFFFPKDTLAWEDKKDMLVFRNYFDGQPHRRRFLEATIGSTMCDVGQINPNPERPDFQKPFMSISEMHRYKFVACIEGNDVATNLKWVMASNSIAVMPRPKMESWFMESRLQPGVHYIEVKDDYSDLEEQLSYYILHPDEAHAIIENAHRYVAQFRNRKLEQWIQYQVVKRYFDNVKVIR